jgi:hypothetical protein
MTESPSHLRDHPPDLQVALLAALLFCRRREITDALVNLLISTVHRIGARAERRVTIELVNAFRRVQGKEGILFRVADAALARPDDLVRRVVFPVVGEDNLRNLVAEYKSSGPAYRRTVQTTYRASYTNHYRAGPIRLLEVLQFRSEDSHQPVLEAVQLVRRYAASPQLTYYPRRGGSSGARWPVRRLAGPGLPHRRQGPPPDGPHDLRDPHLRGAGRPAALQGHLGARRR